MLVDVAQAECWGPEPLGRLVARDRELRAWCCAVRCGDIKALPRTPDLVVSNPPWGVRLTEGEESAWDELGTMLKGHCVGAQAYLLSGNRQVTKHLRLKAGRKWPITIGDVDTRLLQYEIR